MTAVESSGSHAGMTRPVCLMQRRVVAASSLRMRWYATVEPMSATHLNEKSDSVYAPGPRGTPNAGELTAIFDTRARCAVCGESFLGSTIVLDEFVAKRSPSRARRRRLAAARAAARAAAACAATRARGASARSVRRRAQQRARAAGAAAEGSMRALAVRSASVLSVERCSTRRLGQYVNGKHIVAHLIRWATK